MNSVTPEKALETYDMTIKNELPEAYADWVTAVANALNTGDDKELVNYPGWVKDVFNLKRTKKSLEA